MTLGILATIPGFPLLDVNGLVWQIIIWACIAVAFAVTWVAAVAKDVPVLHIQRSIASRVAASRRKGGYRRLDDIQACAGRSG